MKNKLYRIISPVTLLVVLALDAATVAYAVFAVKKLVQNERLLCSFCDY